MKKITCLLCLSFALLLTGCGKEEEVKPTEIKIKTNDIYTQPTNPTDAQAKLYNALTKAVKADATSEETAVLVARNFAMDFFTLKNKKSSQDVGGLTYLPETMRDNFVSYAMYVYANYEIIVEADGKKALPVVSKVTSTNVEANTYRYNDYIPADTEAGTMEQFIPTTCDGYLITVEIEYEDTSVAKEELKTSMTIQVIDLNGRLVIVKAE